MTLRVRLLSMTLSMIAIVALTLIALNVNILTQTSLDVAIKSSEFAGQQVKSVIIRRLSDSTPTPASLEDTKRRWRDEVAHDTDLAALLEQTMAQSRSIVEINVAGEDGKIVASSSSNPRQVGAKMAPKQELRAVQDANALRRMEQILSARDDFETVIQIGIGAKPIFTIQVLVAPVLLRSAVVPGLRDVGIASSMAMIVAFILAYYSANIALRPLKRISHLIDDIASGNTPPSLQSKAEVARELVMIESKLSLLGERYRDARQDASQLRTNLESVLEKLDAGTRQHFENQIALAQRLTAINSLTGRVAHEIKNPLNSISLRLEMLRSRVVEDSPESEPEFAILSEEVTRLDRVVRTFLDFNRPVQLILGDVNVTAAASEILNLLEPEATQKGIQVALEHPDDEIVVKADADLLRQALLNIAVNAIEAMDRGGRLRLAVEKNRDTCSIRFQDTGPGIPAAQRDKIFQLYYTTKPKGSGIGLAMTYRAVQLHGGTIEVEGETGKGTTFRVTLPLAHANGNG
jgi:signal transduction histidine kinase